MPDVRSILIVDDEREIVHLLAEVLGDEGYQVRAAHDGAAALTSIETARPNVVLLDYSMPGMTGAEVLQAIRARYLDLPVIIMSANSRLESLEMSGATAFLAKPFDLDTLLECVERYLAPTSTDAA